MASGALFRLEQAHESIAVLSSLGADEWVYATNASGSPILIVLGTVTSDGDTIVQFLDERGFPRLASLDRLRELGAQYLYVPTTQPRLSPSKASATALDGSLAIVDRPWQNAGVVKAFEMSSFHFQVKNISKSPIEVVRADGSCACTSISIDGDRVLDPGATTSFKVIVQWPHGESFRQECVVKVAQVDSNNEQAFLLPVFACQLPSPRFAPSRLDLGEIAILGESQSDLVSREVSIEVPGGQQMQILGVDFDDTYGDFFETSTTSAIREASCTVVLSWSREELVSKLAIGQHQRTVSITTTNEYLPKICIPLSLVIVPDIKLHPSEVSLGHRIRGGKVQRFFHLSSRSKSAMLLRSIRSDEGCDARLVASEGGMLSFAVSVEVLESGYTEKHIEIDLLIEPHREETVVFKISYYGAEPQNDP